jgi:hypothetical protein
MVNPLTRTVTATEHRVQIGDHSLLCDGQRNAESVARDYQSAGMTALVIERTTIDKPVAMFPRDAPA